MRLSVERDDTKFERLETSLYKTRIEGKKLKQRRAGFLGTRFGEYWKSYPAIEEEAHMGVASRAAKYEVVVRIIFLTPE